MATIIRKSSDAAPVEAQPPAQSRSHRSVGKDCIRQPLVAASNVAGVAITWAIERIMAYRTISFTLLAAVIFYTPSLRNGCRDAGYLFGGDVLDFHWPYVAKLHALLSRWQFTALDFGQFNASSDYFLAANFYPFHPLFVGWALLTPADGMTIDEAGRFLCYSLALHSCIACYTTLRLLTRFYGFEFWPAAFAAAGYAYSIPMICSHQQPMWVFCATVLPWAAYAGLAYAERPTLRGLVQAAFPVVVGYLAGYLPLAIACLGVAVLLIAVRVIVIDDRESPLTARVGRFVLSLMPFILGTSVVLPFLVALFFFLKSTGSDAWRSLFYSAYQMAEIPQSWLRILSTRLTVPGPYIEFTPLWGLVAVGLAVIFFASAKAMQRARRTEWILLQASWLLYGLIVLAIYGQHSPVSDLVYYFVPQVGRMHIYQRFLLPGQIALMIMLAIMLRCIVDARPTTAVRIALAVFVVAAAGAAYAAGRYPEAYHSVGLNNHIIFELLVAVFALGTLLMPSRDLSFAAVLFLFSLPALDHMYDLSAGANMRAEQVGRQGVMLDESLRASLVRFVRRFEDKELVKYVDITPRYTATGLVTFPKTFPDFVLDEVRLSSFVGMNFYLSSLKAYYDTVPFHGDTRFHPDWERMRATGADFVVALETDLPRLAVLTGPLEEGDFVRLPNNVVAAPFSWARPGAWPQPGVALENGYLRVVSVANEASLVNIALGKPARQSSNNTGNAALAVDGQRDGRFERGSVTQTDNQQGAWWEVDLGAVETIGAVRVWNRSECPERLQDFWVTIAEQPFAEGVSADGGATWNRRVGIMPQPALSIDTPGARGRYVRIHLSDPNQHPESILSLAEVEVFPASPGGTGQPVPDAAEIIECRSNDANHVRLEINAKEALRASYLLYPNPLLEYRLDGSLVEHEERNGLATIAIPPGRHVVDIIYRHRTVVLFWIFYAGYAVLLAWGVLASVFESVRLGLGGRHSRRDADRDHLSPPGPSDPAATR